MLRSAYRQACIIHACIVLCASTENNLLTHCQVNNMHRKAFVFLSMFASIFVATFTVSAVGCRGVETVLSPDVRSESIEFEIAIHVLDIFLDKRTAEVKILLQFSDFPYNATQVNAVIKGTGGIEVWFQCKASGGHIHHAESNFTTWFLVGYGERFPFDSYEMDFNLEIESVHFLKGNSSYKVDPNDIFNLAQTEIVIPGPERRPLRDTWWATIPKQTSTGFTANIQRNWIRPIFQMIIPILTCFYLLGGTMLIRRRDLQSRMTAYISIFVFAPVFLMAIQESLPYRSALCFPEVLLTMLLTGTTTFAVFSMWPNDYISIPIRKSRVETDAVAVFTALTFYLVIHMLSLYLWYQMFANVVIAFLLASIVFAHFYGLYFVRRQRFHLVEMLEGSAYGIAFGGSLVAFLGIFLHDFATFLTGAIVFSLAIVLFAVSRWLKRRWRERRRFRRYEASMEYIR